MYIYIYICVYLYLYLSIYLSLSLSIYIYTHIPNIYIYIYIYIYVYVLGVRTCFSVMNGKCPVSRPILYCAVLFFCFMPSARRSTGVEGDPLPT